MTFALALVDNAAADNAEAAAIAGEHSTADDAGLRFVHHTGYWSHFDHRHGTSVWPLPTTSSLAELAAFADKLLVLADDAPEPGDIYQLWSPAKKTFVRTGIVLGCNRPLGYPSGRTGYECLTIDGNTTARGSVTGASTAIVRRTLSPDAGDRLIRWPLIEFTSCESPSSAEL